MRPWIPAFAGMTKANTSVFLLSQERGNALRHPLLIPATWSCVAERGCKMGEVFVQSHGASARRKFRKTLPGRQTE
jgi:membrane protein DedA with SNARE-associated domain